MPRAIACHITGLLPGGIDSNIREFQDLMATAGRSLLMWLVPKQAAVNSQQTQNRSISPDSASGSTLILPSLIRSS